MLALRIAKILRQIKVTEWSKSRRIHLSSADIAAARNTELKFHNLDCITFFGILFVFVAAERTATYSYCLLTELIVQAHYYCYA